MTARPTQPVKLTWDKDPGATAGYDLYRNGAKVASAGANATSTSATLATGDLFEVVGKPSGLRQQVTVSWHSVDVPPTPPPSALTIGLTADKTAGKVLTAPSNAAKAEWARNSTLTSSDPEYLTQALSASFPGTVAKPWVSAIALDQAGNKIGSQFTARIQTTQATPPPVGTARFGISENIGGGGNKTALLALGAKLIREDTAAAIPWAAQNGIDVIQIVYPGGTPDPGAFAHEVVADAKNEPYWDAVDPKAWAVKCLAEVKRVKALGLGKPIIIPLVSYGSTAGNNGMDGYLFPGEYAYPQPPNPYMANHAPWVTTIDQAAPGLLGMVDGFSVHPYFNNPDFHVLDTVRATLKNLGHLQPFWITEVGMYSSIDHSGDAAQLAEFQAEIPAVRARTDVAVCVFYRLSPSSEGSASWGILNGDGSQRPAWAPVHTAMTGGTMTVSADAPAMTNDEREAASRQASLDAVAAGTVTLTDLVAAFRAGSRNGHLGSIPVHAALAAHPHIDREKATAIVGDLGLKVGSGVIADLGPEHVGALREHAA